MLETEGKTSYDSYPNVKKTKQNKTNSPTPLFLLYNFPHLALDVGLSSRNSLPVPHFPKTARRGEALQGVVIHLPGAWRIPES